MNEHTIAFYVAFYRANPDLAQQLLDEPCFQEQLLDEDNGAEEIEAARRVIGGTA